MRSNITRNCNVLVILLTLFSFANCSPTNRLPVVVPQVVSTDMPLAINLTPGIPVVEHDLRITCRLPTGVGDGQFVFGVSDMFSSEGPIDKRIYTRMIVMPCQPIHVYCGYKEYGKELKIIVQDFEPVGDCR